MLELIVQLIRDCVESNAEGHVSKAAEQWATKMGRKYMHAVWLIERFMVECWRVRGQVLEFEITLASLEELSCSALC